MEDPSRLLINLILYGLLPLWGIAGFIDWCCHRATKVESAARCGCSSFTATCRRSTSSVPCHTCAIPPDAISAPKW